MKKIVFLLLLQLSLYSLSLGKVSPQVVLDGKNGGMIEHKPWDSSMLVGKVHTLLYMDPDKRKESSPLLDRLAELKYDRSRYGTIAIVNLAATWMPNSILESILADKQKELTNLTYVFDKTKYMLKKWSLRDDDTNVMIFDKKGRLIYQKSGILSSLDVDKIINTISILVKGSLD